MTLRNLAQQSVSLNVMSFFLAALVPCFVAAAVSEIQVQEGDQIFVRGVNAQIRYTVQPTLKTLRWTVEEGGNWSHSRRGGVLTFEAQEPESRYDVEQTLAKLPPRITLDLQGPSLPFEAHLQDGSIHLLRGQHDARLMIRQGKVVSQSRSGLLKVVGGRVDTQITEHTGRVETDLFGGNSVVKRWKGEGRLDIFNGTLQMDNTEGTVTVNSNQSQIKMDKVSGSTTLDMNKGQFNAQNLQGRLEGRWEEIAANLQVLPETDVSIADRNSRIQVQVPPASGARLRLRSTRGEIAVPTGLRVFRTAEGRVSSGTLRGTSKRINVNVRSEDGHIRVK